MTKTDETKLALHRLEMALGDAFIKLTVAKEVCKFDVYQKARLQRVGKALNNTFDTMFPE